MSFRMSETEFEGVRKAATKLGIGHTGLARALVLGGVAELLDRERPLPPGVARVAESQEQFTPEALEAAGELSKLRLELNRVGTNLNQAVHVLNVDGAHGQAVSQLATAVQNVAASVQQVSATVDAIHDAVFSAPEGLR